MKKNNPRPSNRVYSKRRCKQSGVEFTPTDARQIFSSAQHRIDYHNDLRRIKNEPAKKIIDGISKNAKILEKAYKFMNENKQDKIAVSFLQYDGFDFTMPCETLVSEAGNTIQWYLDYGFEGIDKEKKLFYVHKK